MAAASPALRGASKASRGSLEFGSRAKVNRAGRREIAGLQGVGAVSSHLDTSPGPPQRARGTCGFDGNTSPQALPRLDGRALPGTPGTTEPRPRTIE